MQTLRERKNLFRRKGRDGGRKRKEGKVFMSSMSETKDKGTNNGESNRKNLGLREMSQFQGQVLRGRKGNHHSITSYYSLIMTEWYHGTIYIITIQFPLLPCNFLSNNVDITIILLCCYWAVIGCGTTVTLHCTLCNCIEKCKLLMTVKWLCDSNFTSLISY